MRGGIPSAADRVLATRLCAAAVDTLAAGKRGVLAGIVKGDVLVTESTTEAFNILLPLLGAIVTDNGGLLSHSAIVAREYGIPAVVGCGQATRLLRDGMLVTVDGSTGNVEPAA